MADLTEAGKTKASAKDIAKLEKAIAEGLTSHAAQNKAFDNKPTKDKKGK